MTGMVAIDKISGVKKISMYIPENLWAQFRKLSRATEIPTAALVRRALREFLKRQKKP
jgi:Ribbon-helix-helix domain